MPEQPDLLTLITRQIAGLRSDLGAQIAALGARLDRLVTTDTHQADIRRLDQAQATERSRVDQQMQSVIGDLGIVRQERIEREASIVSSITELRKAIDGERDNRIADAKARDKQRRDDMRWWFGSLVALAAVVVAAIGLIR